MAEARGRAKRAAEAPDQAARKRARRDEPKIDSAAALEQAAAAGGEGLNAIVDLLQLCEDAAKPQQHRREALHALHRVLVDRAAFRARKAAKGASGNEAVLEVHGWLHDQYLEFVTLLLRILASYNAPELHEPAVRVLLDFAVVLSHDAQSDTGHRQACQLLDRLCATLFSSAVQRDEMLELLAREFVPQYIDLRRHMLLAMARAASAHAQAGMKRTRKLAEADVNVATNLYTVLDSITLPNPGEELEEEETKLLLKAQEGSDLAAETTKAFGDCWRQFLRLQLPMDIFRSVLMRMHTDVMPHLADPRWLIDFLRDSYDMGGVIAILSLDALFELIQKHNLDLPDFYPRLYRLVMPEVLYVKHRPRFFMLLDKFLSSTHLPSHLVAAFIKRLSRMALRAPPAGAMALVRFIYNLLKRHPPCLPLIHREGVADVAADPYDEHEPDPSLCRALESSLWETSTLLHHSFPDVARLPAVLETPYLRKSDMDLPRAARASYASLLDRELEKRKVDASIPVTFKPPTTLLTTQQQHLFSLKF